MWHDVVNGLFECFGGFFIFLSCWKLLKQKKVRGVSFIHIAYFTCWGYWNIEYYVYLKQWLSLAGSLPVTAMNTFWLILLIWYVRKERNDKKDLS